MVRVSTKREPRNGDRMINGQLSGRLGQARQGKRKTKKRENRGLREREQETTTATTRMLGNKLNVLMSFIWK